MLIVDEAFADFDGADDSLAPALPASGAVVLRSFGKAYGLPGLRLGFAIASPDIAKPLRAALGPWPVSGPAIAIGARALSDLAWAAATRARLGGERTRLDALLEEAGWRVLGGTRLFRTRRQPGRGAPSSNAFWPRGFSPARSRMLRTGCGSGSREASRNGGGSRRRFQDDRSRSQERLAIPSLPNKRTPMPSRAPRVFTIPSGAPFLPTLSRALLDGRLIEGFPGAGGATALADATIYVPTQRAARALAAALLSASGGQSVLLPRIAPLGAFEPDEAAQFLQTDQEDAPRSEVQPAVGELARRHTLARLTRAWGLALRGAIRSADRDGLITDASEPALVATTPAQAYALAADLAALIDDMIIEGAPWERLETLAPDSY